MTSRRFIVGASLLGLAVGGVLAAKPTPPPPPVVRWGELSTFVDERTKCGEAYGTLTYATTQGNARRRGYFTVDSKVPAEFRVGSSDYAGSGWDTGHLAAARWFGQQHTQDATFSYRNAAPMNPVLNRGMWASIEQDVHELITPGSIVSYAVTPLWLPDKGGIVSYEVIGPHGVAVPTHFGMSVLVEREGHEPQARSWIVPNAPPHEGLASFNFLATVDAHELARGRDFFAWLPDEIEKPLEAGK